MQATIDKKKEQKASHIDLDKVILIKKINFASIYIVRYLDSIYALDESYFKKDKKTKIGVRLWKGILNFLKKNT